jgi:predicted dehydrogenase
MRGLSHRKKFSMSSKVQWGIIGTGGIAQRFAQGLARSQTGTLLAVGSRTQEAAETFGATWEVPRRYRTYSDLLADKDVQAIYISTPHPWHVQWAIAAAEAGKHILCEKPIALNHAETLAIVEAARKNNVFLMEAFMYRCHPQTSKLVELVSSGIIGQVRVIQASFCFNAGENYDPQGRLLNNALGGGGILDVGCYCASIARLLAGAAIGEPFANPLKVLGTGYVGKTLVDEYAIASLLFPNNIVAELITGVRVNLGSEVRIFGSEGSISLLSPFTPGAGESQGIIIKRANEPEQQIKLPDQGADLYALEADAVAQYLEDGQAPAMTWDDTLGNMLTLDQWRAALGVVYDAEIAENKLFLD